VVIGKIYTDFVCLWWQIAKIILIRTIPMEVRHREATVFYRGNFSASPWKFGIFQFKIEPDRLWMRKITIRVLAISHSFWGSPAGDEASPGRN
jgi:hypothetical protein